MINRLRAIVTSFFVCIFTLNPLWADDTDIFFRSVANSETQPNLLFVLDGSGSMSYYDCEDGQVQNASCHDGTPSGTTSRLERMVDAMKEVLDNTSNVNVGLMRFSHQNSGARVLYPLRDIDMQFCNGEPCDAHAEFEAQSRVSASTDDAHENKDYNATTGAMAGAVTTDEPYLPVMLFDGDQQASVTGLRFDQLMIPQGATIVDARIDFTSISDAEDTSEITFKIQDTNDAAPYDNNLFSISSRLKTYKEVIWNELPNWTAGNTIESPDLSSLLQDVVSKNDWCGGNAVGFSMSGIGNRLATSFDRGAGDGPVLRVKYKLVDIPDSGGCTTSTVVASIASTRDDSMEYLSPSWLATRVSQVGNLLRVWPENMSGFSFANVEVPPGSKIKDARLIATTYAGGRNYGDMSMNVSLEDSSNPGTYSLSRSDLSGRSKTGNIVWDDIPTGHQKTAVSPNIGPLLEQVVGKAGWNEGNRVNVFLEYNTGDSDSQRGFYAHDLDVSRSARLRITYIAQIRKATDLINGPVTDVRSKIKEQLDEMVPSGGTPSVGALVEAKRYYNGEPVVYGKRRSFINSDWSARYSRVSHRESYTGGSHYRSSWCNANALNGSYCGDEEISGSAVYTSPMQHECQSNHIVLLTDGQPTSGDTNAIAAAKAITGGECQTASISGGDCGEELAFHMANYDVNPNLPGEQNIITHTIGFNLDIPWLDEVAKSGQGGYYTANTAADLTAAVSNIVASVQNVDSTFVAPGATIDQFTRLSHRSDVYLALFKPSVNQNWSGNLKRYELSGTPPALYDSSNPPIEAVDRATGEFKDAAKSFWSANEDGNDTALGGVAALLNPVDRKIVTYIAASGTFDLLDMGNRITYNPVGDTQLIRRGHTGASSEVEHENILNWLRGIDVKDEDRDGDKTDHRQHIGDPLHSRPVIATYPGGTADEPNSVIFFGTNEGFLHAINAQDGNELYSYMPPILMRNLKDLYDDKPTETRLYGMDGDITLQTTDTNKNGVIDTNETTHLYAGMRRGGRNYYMLNIADKDNPKYRWRITGGSDRFPELGDTWSKLTPATVKVGSTMQKVLIFAGGYDTSQDTKTTRTADTMGRSIYMVDADRPWRVIWAGSGRADDSTASVKHFPEMEYSIPSNVTVISSGTENLASQIYVGDTGGRIWRFDVNNGEALGSDFVDGGIIADLGIPGIPNDGTTATQGDNDNASKAARRFYHAPDISTSKHNGVRMLNISIGSGWQANPLDTKVEDYFYVIRYPIKNPDRTYGKASAPQPLTDPFGLMTTYSPITMDDLWDATSNMIGGEGVDLENSQADRDKVARAKEKAGSAGWFIKMEREGEKILGTSATLDNVVKFVSYVPGFAEEGCSPDIGRSFFWAVNLADGTPHDRLAGSGGSGGDLTKDNRWSRVPGEGIAPAVQTLFVADPDSNKITPADMSGTNVLWNGDSVNLLRRWYWSENPE